MEVDNGRMQRVDRGIIYTILTFYTAFHKIFKIFGETEMSHMLAHCLPAHNSQDRARTGPKAPSKSSTEGGKDYLSRHLQPLRVLARSWNLKLNWDWNQTLNYGMQVSQALS